MPGMNRTRLYDMAHRSTVTFCIAFTGLGTAWLGYKFAKWYIYKRPVQVEMKKKLEQDKMAAEQARKESELLEDKNTPVYVAR